MVAPLLSLPPKLQASVFHDDLAIAIAVYIVAKSMASGIGAAVPGSIWSHDLANDLAEYAPSLNATGILTIAADIAVARISEPRDDIIKAYDTTYRKIALVALVLMFLPLVTSSSITNKSSTLGRTTLPRQRKMRLRRTCRRRPYKVR